MGRHTFNPPGVRRHLQHHHRRRRRPFRLKKRLTACQQYTLLVGEIGIPRDTFLYQLREWEVCAIIKGYRRRHREEWEMTRHVGMTVCCALGADIKTPSDYLPLPWDDNSSRTITEEEARELIELMQRENEEAKEP